MAFVKNSWYCAGWASELQDRPLGIKILNEDIVMFRTASGTPVALAGVCPHRFASLRRGKVVGDRLECPYHGLQFDQTGECGHNPHGEGVIPAGACVRRYPLVSQDGALWVWMGDQAKAEPAAIPSFEFVTDRSKWAGSTGYLRIQGNYQLVIDNLLDLTHAAFIHEGTVGMKSEQWIGGTKMEHRFSVKDGVIHSDYMYRNSPPTPFFSLFADIPFGDIHSPIALHPVSSLILDLTMTLPGQAKSEGVHAPSAHLIVPETETTSHYFYAFARSVKLQDSAITEAMERLVRRAFVEEDEPMIADCQRNMGDSEFFSLRPVILETDVAAVQARRKLVQMLRKESAEVSTTNEVGSAPVAV